MIPEATGIPMLKIFDVLNLGRRGSFVETQSALGISDDQRKGVDLQAVVRGGNMRRKSAASFSMLLPSSGMSHIASDVFYNELRTVKTNMDLRSTRTSWVRCSKIPT
jgi:hypothetical protein